MRGRHFLVLNPEWALREDIEHHAAAVAEALGHAPYDVRHRLLKPGASLLAKDTDPQPLEQACDRLKEAGYRAVVVTEEELRSPSRPERAVSLRQEGDSLVFLGRDEGIVLRVDRQSRLLMVVGDLDARRDAVVRWLLRNENESQERRLNAFIKGRAALRLFDASGGQGVFIKARGFRYPSMGKVAGLSVAHNMRVLLDLVATSAGRVHLDVDFGLADELPVNTRAPVPESEEALVRFERHALVALSLWRAGMIVRAPAVNASAASTTPSALSSLPAAALGTSEGGFFPALGAGARTREALLKVGPLWVSLGLVAVAAIGLSAIRVTQGAAPLGLAGMAGGAFLLLYGFGNWKQKRLLEDYPISRIRSLAMGRVEVVGTAVPRVPMRSPYGDVDCVYFRYQLQEFARDVRGRTRWRTVANGSSSAIPFGIRDETGEILVLPQGARFDLSNRRTLHLGGGTSKLGLSDVGGRTRAIEECIPSYGHVLVMGMARPVQVEPPDRRRELAMRLRALKRDKDRLAGFDINGDGHIDDREWAAAVATVQSEILDERLDPAAESTDCALIGGGETGGLFLISDRSEEKLVRRLAVSTWVGVIGGLGLFLGGVWMMATWSWGGG
ncbi:MAG: hypothetical protein ISR64_08200 [Deltaproteobacteria bacterium]|nr:hypothetical protein [Deltaproteobacteria bacterium]